jgi:stalled ribosome alternative rescue factor ArfA
VILGYWAKKPRLRLQNYKLWTTVTLAPKVEVNKKGIGSVVTRFRTRDYESRVFNSNNPKSPLRTRAEIPIPKVQSYKLWTTVTLSAKVEVNKKGNGSVVTRFRTRDYESRVFNSNNPKIILRKRAESPTPKVQSYKLWTTVTFAQNQNTSFAILYVASALLIV